MKIWEAIIYGIFGGLAELLPVSFQGHYAFLRGAFGLSSLTQGEGCYIRAALCLGVMAAIVLSFSGETRNVGNEILKMVGIKKQRRGDEKKILLRRSILLCSFALVPMLLSLLYTSFADRITSLLYTGILFAVNGLFLVLCFRDPQGEKSEQETTVLDTLLIGLARAVSIFPGLSSIGSSLSVGRVRGLTRNYSLRIACLLTLFYEGAAFLYYLIRAFIYGSFTAGTILPILFALVFSTVFGYLGIQYLRYMLSREKLGHFSYYCWTMAGIVLLLSLINA